MNKTLNTPLGLLLIVCLLLSCTFPQSIPPSSQPTKQSTPEAKHFAISGKVETTGQYCGGAAPPQELLDRLRKKKPYADYKLFVKKGKENNTAAPIIDSTITNSEGVFQFNLPAGEYILLSSDHKTRSIIRACQDNEDIKITDPDCLEEWWENGLAKLTVEDRPVEGIYVHFQKRCFLPLGVPCLDYEGPYPP